MNCPHCGQTLSPKRQREFEQHPPPTSERSLIARLVQLISDKERRINELRTALEGKFEQALAALRSLREERPDV